MSMVRFATICDHCGVKSPEYSAFPDCIECMADVCPACQVPDSYDPEFGRAICLKCEENAHV